MKRRRWLGCLLLCVFWAITARADDRFIVRVTGGSAAIQALCQALGCTVAESIDGSLGQVFLVTTPDTVNANTFLQELLDSAAVVDAELDLLAQADSKWKVPKALYDNTLVTYFGTTVPDGYVNQPATSIVGVQNTQTSFGVKGAGVVAVIDTGVDPNHPALQGVLLQGYDFTRNQSGADETKDVQLSSPPVIKGSQPQWMSPNSSAVVDQSTAAVVDGNSAYNDFGHGTMVTGIVHLVAPGAKILPLKAFRADGTAYTSDILRAVYYAITNNANILNMSFNLASYSQEMANAINLANAKRIISVAAAGNSGEEILVYPAALPNVMGIASTTNDDELSSFSNYGSQLVWVGAPGEGVVTTYPFATYAAGWGTSFSTPFVSGTAALMLDVSSLCDESESAQAMAHAKAINSYLGNGRLETYQAVQAWREMLGIQ